MMRRQLFLFTCIFVLFGVICGFSKDYNQIYNFNKQKASKEVTGFIKKNLLKWINNDILVSAIKEANKKNSGRTQAQIDILDKKWIASTTVEDWMKPYMENPAANFLMEKQKDTENLIAEVFIMDYQGCIVAETSKTSDFLQGDEAKFSNSYMAQAIFIDKIKYDESSKTSSMQISLPIIDKSNANKIVGAITITVDMDKRQLLSKY
jgi:hypothetical protein